VRSLRSGEALRLADRVMRETDSAAIAGLLAEL